MNFEMIAARSSRHNPRRSGALAPISSLLMLVIYATSTLY